MIKYGCLKKKKSYIKCLNNCNSSCRVNVNLQLRFSAQKCPANPCNRSGPRLQMKTCQCHGQKIGRLHLQWGWQKFQVTLAGNKVGGKKPDQFRTGQDTSCNCCLEAWTQTTCVHYPKMDSEEKYRKTLRISCIISTMEVEILLLHLQQAKKTSFKSSNYVWVNDNNPLNPLWNSCNFGSIWGWFPSNSHSKPLTERLCAALLQHQGQLGPLGLWGQAQSHLPARNWSILGLDEELI